MRNTVLTLSGQYYTVYHLPSTTVSQLLIGSVYYYCEIRECAEKLKSVKYNSKQAHSTPARHTLRTQSRSVISDTHAHGLIENDTQVGAISPTVWSPLAQTIEEVF